MRHKQIHYATGAVILLLLAANIFQWRRSAACRNDVRVKEQLIADIGVNTQSVSFLESNWQWNLTAERSDLAQLHVADTMGSYIPLGKIVREPMLVFRFREVDCQECVSFGLRKLGTFAGNDPLLLAQYYDNYPFKKWVRMNRIRFTALNASEALPYAEHSARDAVRRWLLNSNEGGPRIRVCC